MTWTKEDIIKIKQLIKSNDKDNINIGILIAIYTLGMTVDELVDLIDETDIEYHTDDEVNDGYWRWCLECFDRRFCTDVSGISYVMERYNNAKQFIKKQIENYLNNKE